MLTNCSLLVARNLEFSDVTISQVTEPRPAHGGTTELENRKPLEVAEMLQTLIRDFFRFNRNFFN